MKKMSLLIVFVLILATSWVKNSTKDIEDKTFILNQNIGSLNVELGDVMLEYNYLSSPSKLIQFQSQYFEKDLIKIDIMQIKEILRKNNLLELSDFIKKTNDER
jgi:hypothetical protein|tara:strand:+ start:363 stop:674 length:312 start_codon:yes stop_codon:yes gene_type:complete